MSDYLFVVVHNAELSDRQVRAAEAAVVAACHQVVPHNLLSGFRLNRRFYDPNSTLEPFFGSAALRQLPRKKLVHAARAVEALVRWAETQSSPVSLLLEGHRGTRPMPALEQVSGTVTDALSLRRKDPYQVQISLTPGALAKDEGSS